METVEFIKKAQGEVQALIKGTSTKLSPDVAGWIRQDMRQHSEYNMPLMQYGREYPDIYMAQRQFNMMGALPDIKTVGGRLFVEKVLDVALSRLNRILYTLGESNPYGEEIEKAQKLLMVRKDILKRAFAAIMDGLPLDDKKDPKKPQKKPSVIDAKNLFSQRRQKPDA
jgi:hypothetical protein